MKRAAPPPSETQVENSIRSRLQLHGCLVQKNPNEAMSKLTARTKGRGTKIAGTIKGFPDLTVIGPEGRVAFLEVKKPGARPRDDRQKEHWATQDEIRETLIRKGHVAAQVRSQDEAVEFLRAQGWPL